MERNLMIAGFGGQGVMTMGKLLAEATSQATDLNVTFFPSYGAAMRGGTANCYVVISDDQIGAPVSYSLEDLVVMNGPSLHTAELALLLQASRDRPRTRSFIHIRATETSRLSDLLRHSRLPTEARTSRLSS